MGRKLQTLSKKPMDTFNTDPVLEDDFYHIKQYIECIQIQCLEKVDGDTDFKPEQEKLTNTATVSMFNTLRPRV